MVAGIRWGDDRLGLIAGTVLMTQLSISALNDWADRDRDAAAHRWRPVAMGRIRPAVALGLALLFALGALPGALAFGPIAGLVLGTGLAAGWAYDLWLKPTPLSFLPFAIAFPLLPTWVGLIAGRPFASFVWLIVGGAFLATAIHLADSLPDLAADDAVGLRTLAVGLGTDGTIRAIVATLAFGALIFVVALRSAPLIAVLIGVGAAIGATAAIQIARRRPEQLRWIVGATAILTTLAVIMNVRIG
jgi:4-hydroxybenzoate polyprenyltransferase